jgi:hypothetical protein
MNIPTTKGKMYYFSRFDSKAKAEQSIKKLGLTKGNYEIVKMKIKKSGSFFGFLWNEKPKYQNIYVLYRK